MSRLDIRRPLSGSRQCGRFASWHLGVDKKKSAETKGRYEFPMGDYKKLHPCAVLAIESRAAQYDHADIAKAAKKLLKQIDKGKPAG